KEILESRATLSSFLVPAILLVVLNFAVDLFPLSFFAARLAAVRRRGMLEYGILAQTRAAEFQERWIANRAGQDPASLTADATLLADISLSYGNIRHMRPLPADRNSLISLAAAVLVPLFPVVLAEIPFSDIVKGVLQAIKGVPI